MLERRDVGLLVVDIQGKLARLVEESDSLIANTARLVQAPRRWACWRSGWSKILRNSGATVPELRPLQAGILR